MTDTREPATDHWERSDEDVRLKLAIARTIMAWNECEIHLIFYVQALLGVDQFRARTIWAGLPTFDAKRKMLSKLSHTFTPREPHEKFSALLKRCSSLSSNRNILAHGMTFYHPQSRKVHITGDMQHPEWGMNFLGEKTFDLNNIEGWPSAIRALIRDLMDLLPEFAGQVSASSRMHEQDPNR